MRALVRLALVLSSFALVLASPAALHAQSAEGFRLDRYLAPPTTEDGLALQLPTTLGDLRYSVGLVLDYAHAPLVLSSPDRGASAGAIVENRLLGHIVGALGITDRIEFHLRLPIVMVQTGSDPQIGGVMFHAPEVAGLGDGAIGGSVRIIGERDEGFQLGLSAELVVPLATSTTLGGDLAVGARGQALVAYAIRRVLTIGLNVGGAYRPEHDFGTAHIGSELTFGLGVYVTAIERLVIAVEVFGATSFRDPSPFQRTNTPLEGLLGLRYTIEGVTISGGVGAGFTTAPGVPDFRALLGVGYAPPIPEEATAAPEVGDRDGDGILDPDDGCPDEPEDIDQFEDQDGCPDVDNDRDGILDPDDGCPLEPEDVDTFEDTDGCPDVDNDQDHILDADDGCPLEPEDVDQFQDQDGCPDVDNDADGFYDGVDVCPNDPETQNGYDDHDGCPDTVPEQAAVDAISLRILFPHDRWQPTTASRRVIRELAQFLTAHPEIVRVRLEGHADATGDPDHNQELSERRANRVRELLLGLGIDAARLETIGHGETRLDVLGEDEDSHAANRRVVFSIIERADDT